MNLINLSQDIARVNTENRRRNTDGNYLDCACDGEGYHGNTSHQPSQGWACQANFNVNM